LNCFRFHSRVSLADFQLRIAAPHAGQVYAARVVEEDQHIEGSFWLCKVLKTRKVQVGGALHAGQHFLGGTQVADINWLFLVRESGGKRLYKVLPGVEVIAVDAIVNIKEVTLVVEASRRAEPLFALSEEEGRRITVSL
jgi:hypothetical protein